jgi:predicted transcriptional regulator
MRRKPKEAVLTIKLEPELRDAFMAAAEASHRPASQIVRELMREFVQRHQDSQPYDGYLRSKIDIARTQIASGQYLPAEEIEARFSASRAELRARAGDSEQ